MSDATVVQSTGGSPRVAEFREAVQNLRLRATTRSNEPEYYLFIAGAVLVPLGLLIVILGWNGASKTPNTFEQIPYMISGGLLGVALTFAGGFAYFGYFIARLVAETKAENNRTIEAIGKLEELLEANLNGTRPAPVVAAAPAASDRPVAAPSAPQPASEPDDGEFDLDWDDEDDEAVRPSRPARRRSPMTAGS